MKDLFHQQLDDKSEFFLDIEVLENLPEGYLKDFKSRLLSDPNYDKIKDRYIIHEDKNTLVYILEKVSIADVADLTDEERFFYPLCNKDEIKRIFNPQNADDFLLKYRAEQIIDNMRLHRVFSSIRQKKNDWNFTNYFKTGIFKSYLQRLPMKLYRQCKDIPFGTIYLKEANGYCMKTEFGNIVVISFALRYFLYYMNLFHFGSQLKIKENDTFHSMLIAIRTMLGTEALDFEIDVRGKIPLKAHKQITAATDWQMLFIIGHEFAHHYLNHLDKSSFGLLNSTTLKSDKDVPFYNYSEQLELDADYHSIISPIISDEERTELADGAFLFFFWLDLYEVVEQFFFPPTSSYRTHPKPVDRIRELRKRLDSKFGLPHEALEKQIEAFDALKQYLIKEVLPFRTDDFEVYGSLYLPSYKKEMTVDRIHF